MRNKRKKGSSIMLILMVATIMIITSSVVATSLVSTTRMNTVGKRYDDLTYSAESGIEQVLSNARRGEYRGLSIGENIREFDLNNQFIEQEIEVHITGKVINYSGKKAIEAISISKDLRNETQKTVKGIITEGLLQAEGSSNLLKYSICGKNVNIFLAGGIDFGAANVNASNSLHVDANPPNGNPMNENFTIPKFNENLVPKYVGAPVEVKSYGELKQLGVKDVNSSEYRGVVYKEIETGTSTDPKMEFFFVNTPSLILNTNDIEFQSMQYTVILSNGSVTFIQNQKFDENRDQSFIEKIDKITGLPLGSSLNDSGKINFIPSTNLKQDKASIIADTVNLYGTVYHTNYPTYDTGHPIISHSPINSESELSNVMNTINLYLDETWGGNVGGEIIPTYEITDIEYN